MKKENKFSTNAMTNMVVLALTGAIIYFLNRPVPKKSVSVEDKGYQLLDSRLTKIEDKLDRVTDGLHKVDLSSAKALIEIQVIKRSLKLK